MAEEQERRLVMTGSVCLDKFIVDTERLSASRIQKKNNKKNMTNAYQFYIELVKFKERKRGRKRAEVSHLSGFLYFG